jgi:hypothetical protein
MPRYSAGVVCARAKRAGANRPLYWAVRTELHKHANFLVATYHRRRRLPRELPITPAHLARLRPRTGRCTDIMSGPEVHVSSDEESEAEK